MTHSRKTIENQHLTAQNHTCQNHTPQNLTRPRYFAIIPMILLAGVFILTACGGGGVTLNATINGLADCAVNPFDTRCTAPEHATARDTRIKECLVGNAVNTPICLTARVAVPCLGNPFTDACATDKVFAPYVQTATTARATFCRMGDNLTDGVCRGATTAICASSGTYANPFDAMICPGDQADNQKAFTDNCNSPDMSLRANANCDGVLNRGCATDPFAAGCTAPRDLTARDIRIKECLVGDAVNTPTCLTARAAVPCIADPYTEACATDKAFAPYLQSATTARATFCRMGNNSADEVCRGATSAFCASSGTYANPFDATICKDYRPTVEADFLNNCSDTDTSARKGAACDAIINCINNPFATGCNADIYAERREFTLNYCNRAGNEDEPECLSALTNCASASPNPHCGDLTNTYCTGLAGRTIAGDSSTCTARITAVCPTNPFAPVCTTDFVNSGFADANAVALAQQSFCQADNTNSNCANLVKSFCDNVVGDGIFDDLCDNVSERYNIARLESCIASDFAHRKCGVGFDRVRYDEINAICDDEGTDPTADICTNFPNNFYSAYLICGDYRTTGTAPLTAFCQVDPSVFRTVRALCGSVDTREVSDGVTTTTITTTLVGINPFHTICAGDVLSPDATAETRLEAQRNFCRQDVTNDLCPSTIATYCDALSGADLFDDLCDGAAYSTDRIAHCNTEFVHDKCTVTPDNIAQTLAICGTEATPGTNPFDPVCTEPTLTPNFNQATLDATRKKFCEGNLGNPLCQGTITSFCNYARGDDIFDDLCNGANYTGARLAYCIDPALETHADCASASDNRTAISALCGTPTAPGTNPFSIACSRAVDIALLCAAEIAPKPAHCTDSAVLPESSSHTLLATQDAFCFIAGNANNENCADAPVNFVASFDDQPTNILIGGTDDLSLGITETATYNPDALPTAGVVINQGYKLGATDNGFALALVNIASQTNPDNEAFVPFVRTRLYAGMLHLTDLGAPIINNTANGFWSATLNAIIQRDVQKDIGGQTANIGIITEVSDDFTLVVNFTDGTIKSAPRDHAAFQFDATGTGSQVLNRVDEDGITSLGGVTTVNTFDADGNAVTISTEDNGVVATTETVTKNFPIDNSPSLGPLVNRHQLGDPNISSVADITVSVIGNRLTQKKTVVFYTGVTLVIDSVYDITNSARPRLISQSATTTRDVRVVRVTNGAVVTTYKAGELVKVSTNGAPAVNHLRKATTPGRIIIDGRFTRSGTITGTTTFDYAGGSDSGELTGLIGADGAVAVFASYSGGGKNAYVGGFVATGGTCLESMTPFDKTLCPDTNAVAKALRLQLCIDHDPAAMPFATNCAGDTVITDVACNYVGEYANPFDDVICENAENVERNKGWLIINCSYNMDFAPACGTGIVGACLADPYTTACLTDDTNDFGIAQQNRMAACGTAEIENREDSTCANFRAFLAGCAVDSPDTMACGTVVNTYCLRGAGHTTGGTVTCDNVIVTDCDADPFRVRCRDVGITNAARYATERLEACGAEDISSINASLCNTRVLAGAICGGVITPGTNPFAPICDSASGNPDFYNRVLTREVFCAGNGITNRHAMCPDLGEGGSWLADARNSDDTKKLRILRHTIRRTYRNVAEENFGRQVAGIPQLTSYVDNPLIGFNARGQETIGGKTTTVRDVFNWGGLRLPALATSGVFFLRDNHAGGQRPYTPVELVAGVYEIGETITIVGSDHKLYAGILSTTNVGARLETNPVTAEWSGQIQLARGYDTPDDLTDVRNNADPSVATPDGYADDADGTNILNPITGGIKLDAVRNKITEAFVPRDFTLLVSFDTDGGVIASKNPIDIADGRMFNINGRFNDKGIIYGTTNYGKAGAVSNGSLTGLIGASGAVGAFISEGDDNPYGIYAGGFVAAPALTDPEPSVVNYGDWTSGLFLPLPATIVDAMSISDSLSSFLSIADGGTLDNTKFKATRGGAISAVGTLKREGDVMDGIAYVKGFRGLNGPETSYVSLLPTTNLGAPFPVSATTAMWTGNYYNSAVGTSPVTFAIDFSAARTITGTGTGAGAPVFDLVFNARGVISGTVVSTGVFSAIASGLIGAEGLVGGYISPATAHHGGFVAQP